MSDSESAASMSESESRRTKFETRRSNHEAQRRHDADESADDYESNSDGNNGIYISDDDHYAIERFLFSSCELRYFNTTSTSQVHVYLGCGGLLLKMPLMILHTTLCCPIGTPLVPT